MTMTSEQDREFRALMGKGSSNGRIRRMSDVRSRTIKWAWKGRMALGYLTVWTGEEGLGKSVFCAWLAAQVTHGRLDGDWHGKPVDMLLVAGEDGLEDTWKPRLEMAGADCERVASLNLDDDPAWNVRDGIGALREAILATNAKLVVFDALLDHLPTAGGGENINSPTFVRAALAPLRDLVRELGIVAVISLHPPKARGVAFRDTVQASQAFSAIPRTGLLFGWHPDDAEDDPLRRRVILRGKGNRGRNPGALEFSIAGQELLHDSGEWQEVEAVRDVRPSDLTVVQLLARPQGENRPVSKAEQAAEIIRSELPADDDWHDSAPIRETLKQLQLDAGSTITNGRQLAKVESRQRPGVAHGGTEWRLVRATPVSFHTESDPPNGSNPQQPQSDSGFPALRLAESDRGSGA